MTMHRYSTVACFGEWKSTRKEACKDALRAGQARPDISGSDGILWAVPGRIESRAGTAYNKLSASGTAAG
jgi:hypothetical protein